MFFKSRKEPDPAAQPAAPAQPATKPAPAPPLQAAAPSPPAAPKPAQAAKAPAAAGSNGGAAPATDPLSPEEKQRRANYSHGLVQAFGAIVAIYMKSKFHREMRLSEIENIVGPAVMSGQFSLAEATHKQHGLVTPVAAVLWAGVSDAIDARLSAQPEQPMNLTPADWKSGNTIWIVEAIGDQKVVGAMLGRLQESTWNGRTVKMRSQGEGGRIIASTLAKSA